MTRSTGSTASISEIEYTRASPTKILRRFNQITIWLSEPSRKVGSAYKISTSDVKMNKCIKSDSKLSKLYSYVNRHSQ